MFINTFFSKVLETLRPNIHPKIWDLIEGVEQLRKFEIDHEDVIIRYIPLSGEFDRFEISIKYLDNNINIGTKTSDSEVEQIHVKVTGAMAMLSSQVMDKTGWKYSHPGFMYSTTKVDIAIKKAEFALDRIRKDRVRDLRPRK